MVCLPGLWTIQPGLLSDKTKVVRFPQPNEKLKKTFGFVKKMAILAAFICEIQLFGQHSDIEQSGFESSMVSVQLWALGSFLFWILCTKY